VISGQDEAQRGTLEGRRISGKGFTRADAVTVTVTDANAQAIRFCLRETA
jgi:hypothetical protein